MEKADNEKPDPPAQGECCESGCDPCVWDLYQEALDQWKKQQQNEDTEK